MQEGLLQESLAVFDFGVLLHFCFFSSGFLLKYVVDFCIVLHFSLWVRSIALVPSLRGCIVNFKERMVNSSG